MSQNATHIQRINDNIWKLERTARSLNEELKMIEALPKHNINGFTDPNRSNCLRRVARKIRLNKNALQHNLDLLAGLTKK